MSDLNSSDTYTADELQMAVDNQALADASPSSGSGTDWFSGLSQLLSAGVGAFNSVNNADNAAAMAKVKSDAAAAAALAKANASATTSSTLAKLLPWALGAAAVVLGIVLILRLKK